MRRNWFLIHGLEKEVKREKRLIDDLSKIFEDKSQDKNSNVLNDEDTPAFKGDIGVICNLYMEELEFCNTMSKFISSLIPCLRPGDSFKLSCLLEEYLSPCIDWLVAELNKIAGKQQIFKH